ncbi:hypothetical protein Tco_0713145 [Tanacetum coccineum]
MSSAKAAYVVITGCYAQVLWIKSQLADYDVLNDKVPIFFDNTSVIAISNNSVLHSRTKHIDIGYHFIKDHILKGDIELHFVPTDLQLANILTNLAEPSFTILVAELGDAYKNDKLKTFKPCKISITSFKTPSALEVPLTSHMLKVAKLSPVLEETLILPSGGVNADDTANKSPFRIVVQLHAKEPVATTDATKIINAYESTEELGIHPKPVDAIKAMKEPELTSLGNITFKELYGHADESPCNTEDDRADFDLESMSDDEIESISKLEEDNNDESKHAEELSVEDEAVADDVIDELVNMANNQDANLDTLAAKPTNTDPLGHLYT